MNRPLRHLVSIGAACAAVLGASGAGAEDWGSLGLDPGRTRLATERSGTAFSGEGWQHALPPEPDAVLRALLGSPALGDGHLAVGSYGGLVRVLRAADGQALWDFRSKGSLYASPVIWRGQVFVVDVDQQLHALDLRDGKPLWQRDLGAVVYASPVVVDGDLFVAIGNPAPGVLRLDARTGQRRWRTDADVFRQAVLAPVAVGGGLVVAGEMGGRYVALDLTDGKPRWTVMTGGRVNVAAPLVVGGRVYVAPGGSATRLHAFDLATGAAITGWPIELPGVSDAPPGGKLLTRDWAVSSLAAAGGRLVLVRRADDRLDSDADGVADRFVSREQVVAVDGARATVAWSADNGVLASSDANAAPTHGFTPTPALYPGMAGETLVAVPSSVQARLRVLDLATGAERWSVSTGGRTRGSPSFSNGRLHVGTDTGLVHGFVSAVNLPPVAPTLGLAPAGGAEVPAPSAILRWGAAFDREAQLPSYVVRLDDDGELLRDWDLEVTTAPGVQELPVQRHVLPGRTYTFAVRARDPHGALSDWSRPETFRATAVASVTLDGREVDSLAAALALAGPNSQIGLGAGRVELTATLNVPTGARVHGAGPHLTVIDGNGLPVAVAPATGALLEQLTVAHGEVGVKVENATGVRLRNVILRDNARAGLEVSATGAADLVSATLVRNGTAVLAAGAIAVRNALVSDNDVGLHATAAGLLTTRYNDVTGNRSKDWDGAAPALGDFAAAVAFGPEPDDLRLSGPQASTDRGDPADDFQHEPLPNGGRINVGAFGNTVHAEPSVGEQPDGGAAGSAARDAASDGAIAEVPSPGTADAATMTEAGASGTPMDGAGCGCEVGAARSGGQGAFALGVLIGLMAVLRRRRRPR